MPDFGPPHLVLAGLLAWLLAGTIVRLVARAHQDRPVLIIASIGIASLSASVVVGGALLIYLVAFIFSDPFGDSVPSYWQLDLPLYLLAACVVGTLAGLFLLIHALIHRRQAGAG